MTKELFKVIISTTETETKKKSVQEARRYILSNWKRIGSQYEVDYAGCSAEGHVSHILSSQLSSRPLGWCKNRSRLDGKIKSMFYRFETGNAYYDAPGGRIAGDIRLKRQYASTKSILYW